MAKTTIEFNDHATDQLNELSGLLGTTKAEILRSALTLYAFVTHELTQTEGDASYLGILNRDGKADKIVVVPGLRVPVRKRSAERVPFAATAGDSNVTSRPVQHFRTEKEVSDQNVEGEHHYDHSAEGG